ncbi:sugar transport 8-like [Olea europaea subsp. europaea]|uniref:Sugar transport 8-like n=1 Tax=Olea europaea subsp. europaea TaxID=158383 RepID=A0A8S0VB07_OLEEU|nr:sugar transport 8-like [Olea europaea subsp. europaea]
MLVPNPLFDLAGIMCGQFGIPFWEFFLATLIGKAIIKTHIQTVFIISVCNNQLLDWMENELIWILSFVPGFNSVLPNLITKLHSVKDKYMAMKPNFSSKSEVKKWDFSVAFIWNTIVWFMLIGFFVKIVNATAQRYLKKQQEKEIASLKNKSLEISESQSLSWRIRGKESVISYIALPLLSLAYASKISGEKTKPFCFEISFESIATFSDIFEAANMANHDGEMFKSKITVYVLACWILASFGGLMFGYDIGISGKCSVGVVTGMDDFLIKFFPKVEIKLHASENNYCKYDDQMLQLFTSSLYLAALVASFFASKACSILGRKPTIMMASLFFIAGAAFSAFAEQKWCSFFGEFFLAFEWDSEMRSCTYTTQRGFITTGIFIANLVNYVTSTVHPYGGRLSLGLASVPAIVLFLGFLIITESPPSLIVEACEQARQVKQPFKKLFKKDSMLLLIIAIAMQIFQQFTGINAIMFYAPVLFQTLGFKTDASLLSSVITVLVNVGSTFVSIFSVDKLAIGFISHFNLTETGSLDRVLAAVVVVLVCTYVMSFAWCHGHGVHLAYIFFFFSAWILVMGIFVVFLLPETKGVPIDLMVERVWKQHPVWKKFFNDGPKSTYEMA